MEVRQIYYVLEVAKQKNFSKAAQALYITQPTISQQIRNLEAEFGITLFKRDTHSVTLTEEGEKFCKYGRQVIASIDELMDAFGQNTTDNKAMLRIGVYTFYKNTVLSRTITSFILDNANTLCSVSSMPTYEAYEKLRNDELDFAFIKSRPDLINNEFKHIELIHNDPLMLLASIDSELADRETISMVEASGHPIVSGAQKSHLYESMKALYNENGKDINVALATEDADLVLELVRSGFTYTFITQSSTLGLNSENGFVTIPIVPEEETRVCLVYRKDARIDGIKKIFINTIINAFAE